MAEIVCGGALHYQKYLTMSGQSTKMQCCMLFFQAFYIWVARDAPIDVIQALFNVPNFGSIPENLVGNSFSYHFNL